MKIFTIGFTKTSAKSFFDSLKEAGVKRVLDVRLNNKSQLAGFAKQDDLKFFAKELSGADYEHLEKLAPKSDMLKAYREKAKKKKEQKKAWDAYEKKFLELMAEREIEKMGRDQFDGGCLLCSEDEPHYCHRKLVAQYLREKWDDVEIHHLTPSKRD